METATISQYQENHGFFNSTSQQQFIPPGRMSEPKGYTIVPIAVEDTNRVIDFLKTYFFHDEPLNICVGLLDEPGSRCEELENYCSDAIPEGVSIMAVSPKGQILGVCINGILRRDDPDTDELGTCKNLKYRKIFDLLINVSRNSDFFGHFPDVDSCLEIKVVSVSDECRGQGIARALFNNCRVVAKEKGVPMIKVDCTSHFSALAVSKLGYRCFYQLNYSDYLDEEGKPVFVPGPPHLCVKTFALNVD